MPKLSTGQKRHQKDLRRKKRHPQSKHATMPKHYHIPMDFLDMPLPLGTTPKKLSAVIWEYAMPVLDVENQTEEEVYTSLSLAMLCWNIGLLEPYEQSEMVNLLLTQPEKYNFTLLVDNSIFEELVRQLIKTRQTLYQSDDRYIMDFSLTSTADRYHLQVLSTYSLPDSPEYSINPFR